MKITGYTEPMTARPGDTVALKVSTKAPAFDMALVRLRHGDPNPAGPGFRETVIAHPDNGRYPGRFQPIVTGSYGRVPDAPDLSPAAGLTLGAWICPTTPDKGLQAIISKWTGPGAAGWGLFLENGGDVALRIADGRGGIGRVRTGRPLAPGRWYFVAASYDPRTGRASVIQRPARRLPDDPAEAAMTEDLPGGLLVPVEAELLFAAVHWSDPTDPAYPSPLAGHFNGKIDAPCLVPAALTLDREAADPALPLRERTGAIWWDFGRDFDSRRLTDGSGRGHTGETVNLPARGVTGHCWTGRFDHFLDAPAEYAAIHFHDDDLDDAKWDTDVALRLPDDLPSGIYAFRLRPAQAEGDAEGSAAEEDHVPLFVCARPATPGADVAFLAPTCSYLAYGNEQLTEVPMALCPNQNPDASKEAYAYAADNHLLSLYERHSDGSGVFFSSRRRPIVSMRPKFYMMATDGPHQLSGDLHLVDWLMEKEIAHDVLTDEALHLEGIEALNPYRVIVTGTHPEYWSERMLEALETYMENGGRVMYLGGNGFYWVTSFHPDAPHVIEIRRADGIRTWESAPGERYHASTGERGGLWRWRGRPPQALVGVGFTAQGFDRNSPYKRREDSHRPGAAFVFDGLGPDALIGDHPSLVLKEGAAGYELDRMDPGLGTPDTAYWLAASFDHSDAYQHSVEEVLMSDSRQGGSVNPLVRADMVYFKHPNDGAVFSVGSISWCGSLSYNDYENSVSRVTENVLRRFLDPLPLPSD
ncbi:MAG: LamG-like jellyroll fold domain-containing protein [Alphaproteobacteria bacterium]